jgi:hypothetical protein
MRGVLLGNFGVDQLGKNHARSHRIMFDGSFA